MFGFTRYNYDRFRREMLQNDPADPWGSSPAPGDEAPDFELCSLTGELVKLSDFKNSRNVLITFGSATCPQTAASIGGLRSLAREFASSDVEFLFLYVREAHPGLDLPAHHSMADKIHAAQIFQEEEEVEFPVLVDELSGATHHKYGALPNASFLVDKGGRIAYRSLASHTSSLGGALEELLERQKERGVAHAVVHGGEDKITPSLKTFLNAYRAIERGGPDAAINFRSELGIPGRMVLSGGRMARPITEHPVIAITTVLGVVGAISLGLWAGRELRKRRMARLPYEAYRKFEKRRGDDEDDYTALGI